MWLKRILYISAMALFISAIGLLQMIDAGMIDMFYYVAVSLALGLGIVHVMAMKKVLQSSGDTNHLGMSLLIIAFSVLVSGGIYYFTGLNMLFMTFIIAFIVPYTSVYAFRYFIQIV